MYQKNSLLFEVHAGKVAVVATPIVSTGIGSGIGALGGHIASKFGGKNLTDEERAERAKRFRRRGALAGAGLGLTYGAQQLGAFNKDKRKLVKKMWNDPALNIKSEKGADRAKKVLDQYKTKFQDQKIGDTLKQRAYQHFYEHPRAVSITYGGKHKFYKTADGTIAYQKLP